MTQCRAPVQRDVTLSRGKCWSDFYTCVHAVASRRDCVSLTFEAVQVPARYYISEIRYVL